MAIHTQELSCDAGGVTMKNFLAYDDSISGARPAVMVVHEWWGLDDYIRGRCEQLAGAGFAALGVDMYGGGQTGSNPDEAGALMNAVFADIPAASERIKGAAAALGATEQADADRMACMGYCFGGAVSLHAARLGALVCTLLLKALGPVPGPLRAVSSVVQSLNLFARARARSRLGAGVALLNPPLPERPSQSDLICARGDGAGRSQHALEQRRGT